MAARWTTDLQLKERLIDNLVLGQAVILERNDHIMAIRLFTGKALRDNVSGHSGE